VQYIPRLVRRDEPEIISENHRFNDWMFRQVNKGLRETSGKVPEVASGLGTISDRIIQYNSPQSKLILTPSICIYKLDMHLQARNVKIISTKS
jgi:hypothetical protein